MTAYLLERAWIGDAVVDDVRVEIEGGRFTGVDVLLPRFTGKVGHRLPGLTLPGLANAHSHAFHRALRGRTQRGGGTFWTWREQMYDVAGRLDPDSYHRLATAVFREMAAAGMTTVGEFHYLHHQPDGTPYDEPHAMALALVEAARTAGIRIALLDTCYLSSGFGAPPRPAQLRYSWGSAAVWATQTAQLRRWGEAQPHVAVGAAIHSVRAVPRADLPTVVEAARGGPLHVHLSEQVQENDDCRAAYGVTPTALLQEAGALGPDTTVVHATHLTDADVERLGTTGTTVCMTPTTERDLGDGIGPSRALHDAGARLSLGSDSHAVVDLFEEMRAVELDERLATQRRGHWSAAELLAAATRHDSLGFADAGRIEVGARADLVTLATDTPTTAGTGADEQTAVFAATAADVTHVVIDGRVVYDGDRAAVGRALHDEIQRLMG
ncbi:formimidoylglutamate deiminase [Nocardioides lianchengensis]|uniref:Formiminoglutamate deiminase n=1 Tax=Nocardioides lianchengensis TaxID=1045774 RepID=A0A1G7AIA9_9ACTN|nr:formimidoylglutamate deiminase [Nocardioides lianchengensis]NYG13590.1 formiminoglutamate deiminase [Nocardioides lianchengensis]SDE13775.1 formiminoglutamate deiminase [Nocardioides lianchengensis]